MLLHESEVTMEQSMPENLSTHVDSDCEVKRLSNCHEPVNSDRGLTTKDSVAGIVSSLLPPDTRINKVKLSFSVDRLLGSEPCGTLNSSPSVNSSCDGSVFSCYTLPQSLNKESAKNQNIGQATPTSTHPFPYTALEELYPGLYMDFKSVLRPTPIRQVEHAASSYPSLATNTLVRFHQYQQRHHFHHQHKPPHISTASVAAALLAPLHSLNTLQHQRFLGKTLQQVIKIPATSDVAPLQNVVHISGTNNIGNKCNSSSNGRRKRSWSRAVFTNLQRKGLEIQFQQQKYITKPDRRKLAARLNLTDAQVKVWFQNRRMKWRHTRENLKSGQEKQHLDQPPTIPGGAGEIGSKVSSRHKAPDYSSDSCATEELTELAEEDDSLEIDVVE
ncbi:hypothetical protein KR009_008469 [Drosophila setifemur]|nr:hypothetical protein KR009_008469 [Drosophila setifemur]